MRCATSMAVLLVGSAVARAEPAAAPSADVESAPHRVSLAVQQDFGFAAADAPCARDAQLSEGFACFRADGAQYHGAPQLGSDAVGPAGLSTTRLMVGYDLALLGPLAFGLRLGWAFRGGPKPDGADAPAFLPLHLEARAALWWGEPASAEGFRAALFGAGGIAQIDTAWSARVSEDRSVPPPAIQLDNPDRQVLDVYHKAGTGWLGGGVTVAYAPVVTQAIVIEGKVMGLFPSIGVAIAPVVGYEIGF